MNVKSGSICEKGTLWVENMLYSDLEAVKSKDDLDDVLFDWAYKLRMGTILSDAYSNDVPDEYTELDEAGQEEFLDGVEYMAEMILREEYAKAIKIARKNLEVENLSPQPVKTLVDKLMLGKFDSVYDAIIGNILSIDENVAGVYSKEVKNSKGLDSWLKSSKLNPKGSNYLDVVDELEDEGYDLDDFVFIAKKKDKDGCLHARFENLSGNESDPAIFLTNCSSKVTLFIGFEDYNYSNQKRWPVSESLAKWKDADGNIWNAKYSFSKISIAAKEDQNAPLKLEFVCENIDHDEMIMVFNENNFDVYKEMQKVNYKLPKKINDLMKKFIDL